VTTFQQTVQPYVAGTPQDERVRWVGLHPGQICRKMAHVGIAISRYLVATLLAWCGLRRRRYRKTQCLGQTALRNAQFEHIARLREAFADRDWPILSRDTKNKERLGNFDRGETDYGLERRAVNEHDFPSAATGLVIPHGIYDVTRNHGYLTLGTSHDTSECVCDNLLWYWQQDLQWHYPEAAAMLLLCDGGGSTGCRHTIVKYDLARMADRLGLHVLVAHYPAYCSKWNPIEHRLFCHLHRAWQGALFHSLDLVKELALTTATTTGLTVSVRINPQVYATGRVVPEDWQRRLNHQILFDDDMPQWNYLVRAGT
jgi:hypothetical protein